MEGKAEPFGKCSTFFRPLLCFRNSGDVSLNLGEGGEGRR